MQLSVRSRSACAGSFVASPTGGVLVLRFSDAGGDPYWDVNSLEIRPVAAVSSLLLTGPGGSLAADGLTTDRKDAMGRCTPVDR